MFIQTEETPNPATMKFLPGRDVMGQGTLEVVSEDGASQSPLAHSLFGIEGVRGVFLGKDFITVTKDEAKNWATMKPPVLTAIMEHFSSGKPMIAAGETILGEVAGDGDPLNEGPVVAKIRDLLDHKIRPAVAQDGGDITFESYEDGIVTLNLKGSCAGCPSSAMTLKAGVESMLRHHIPEIREVRQSR
ncbi:MAG: NifU family protein [Alphaproteobacteria bacterium]|nr:NifU family protein [Alphaproteobacteria bacterium]